MSPISDRFERQIKRIHSLIERDGISVTWNDRVTDPDNPSRTRQIDVTLRAEGNLTLIECRIHSEPQDVTWIEELIGRRASLNADAIIAVSASGFTKGAILKAEAFGIILRDFASLTEQEISAWGARTRVVVHLHHFDNIALRFVFSTDAKGKIVVDDVERAIRDLTIELFRYWTSLLKNCERWMKTSRRPGSGVGLLQREIWTSGESACWRLRSTPTLAIRLWPSQRPLSWRMTNPT
jgi:hypothetical protein